MDVFILGAGRPARGTRPSALKKVGLHTQAVDWQIRSFGALDESIQLHYLGGYHVEEVIRRYPRLSFTVIPDWAEHSVLHTLLQAPFSKGTTLITYSDTVFRREDVEALVEHRADVTFCVDSHWEERYQGRSENDIAVAETLNLSDFGASTSTHAEFTGLMKLGPTVVEYLSTVSERAIGTSLVDLLTHLQARGFRLDYHDVAGRWAELNSPVDVAQFILGTKAETLARLEPVVQKSQIGKQVRFTTGQWRETPTDMLLLVRENFRSTRLVVRSSALSEDSWHESNAGGYESVLGVDGGDGQAVADAINAVAASFGSRAKDEDQILIQQHVEDVHMAGVVFTCGLETGAPYYCFNFDDETRSTDRVTAGTHGGLRTITLSRGGAEYLDAVEPAVRPVLDAVRELEELLGFDKLDIEFAVGGDGKVHIFQVRPITVDHSDYEIDDERFFLNLAKCGQRFASLQAPSPFVFGDRCLFGNMPDWNPAEIIGTRPRPLAFSLYRHLITNDTWARQRAEFGYRDVRPHPLIVSFSGQPYVDIRASLNSFIPATLPEELGEKLIRAYVQILLDRPSLHDKIEFAIAFTVWTPTFAREATERLLPYGLTRPEIDRLGQDLKVITRRAIERLETDTASIRQLTNRRQKLEQSGLSPADLIFALLDDCRRFGTLAFSHAARAGFVATTFANSFVEAGIFTSERRLQFLRGITTVAGEFQEAKTNHAAGTMSREELLHRFGHLRPGTYEISAEAYWEAPERYFAGDSPPSGGDAPTFLLTSEEESGLKGVLDELGASQSPAELLHYMREGIRSRESTKLEFTRSLSKALDACVALGEELSLTRDEISYLDYHDLEQLRLNNVVVDTLHARVARRKREHLLTLATQLPSLISDETDFYCFERPSSEPNFITTSRIEAEVRLLNVARHDGLAGKIVLIPQADPGFDWLFGHDIAGLVTQFGGANSHMAIRAAEMGLPAAIGVGEKIYEQVARSRRIELNCANRLIRELP